MRVLDLDLDFFVHGVKHWPLNHGQRLDASEFPAWSLDQCIEFLQQRCGLNEATPGVALEYHHELFGWWRERIREGRLRTPFTVVHVDAHADLGLGDSGYIPIITDLLFREPAERCEPKEEWLTEGNFLAFAAACRWIEDLTYVRNEPFGPPADGMPFSGHDLPQHFMKDNDLAADALQLKAVDPADFKRRFTSAEPVSREPEIPFRYVYWKEWTSSDPFDLVCVTRSPSYTPEESDVLFDEIRTRFIDEKAWAS